MRADAASLCKDISQSGSVQRSHRNPRWDVLEPRVATTGEGGLVTSDKALVWTREVRVPLPPLPFQAVVTWFAEGCRYHILKSDPQKRLHLAAVLLRTCGLKFSDKISLSLKHLHQAGSKESRGWVCSPMCHDGSHGPVFPPATSAFSVRVTWNS